MNVAMRVHLLNKLLSGLTDKVQCTYACIMSVYMCTDKSVSDILLCNIIMETGNT